MDKEKIKEYILCVEEKSDHHPEAIIRKCHKCFNKVWCMPLNILRIPVCIECVNSIQIDFFCMDKENVHAAVEEIKRRKNES